MKEKRVLFLKKKKDHKTKQKTLTQAKNNFKVKDKLKR